MKAGKVCFGADSVEQEINKRKVKLVVIAEDSSERTKNKFTSICKEKCIPVIIDESIDNLSKTIGKSNKAIIGIKDINFAKSIQKKYNGGEIIG
jgi:ribosomal protein L7Ae-like RNA K-turn-binding protein